MSIEEIALEAEERMEKSVTLLTDQLRGVRTGRANTGLVDSIRVEYYGSLDAAEAAGQPEHARAAADPDPPVRPLGHRRHRQGDPDQRPGPDAQLRRQGGAAQRPALSVEQRKKLSNRVKDLAEEARVSIRNIRRDANKQADQEQSDKILTEDDLATCKEEIQSLTKKFEAKVNDLADKKSAEILEV